MVRLVSRLEFVGLLDIISDMHNADSLIMQHL